MAETGDWYLTPISRDNSNDPTWDVDINQSGIYHVWFGTQAEFDTLPDPGIYDIVIVDGDGDGLINASEMRAALTNSSAPNPSNNSGYLGEDNVDYSGNGPSPTVAYSTGNQGIQATTDAILITLEPIDPAIGEISADYKGGVGNFDPFDPSTLAPPCFTQGTLITTPSGERVVESLRTGDLVWTVDHGYQPVRWIGSRNFSKGWLAIQPSLRPIRISAGALGDNLPSADLLVSQQHRVMIRSKIAQRMFGCDEILVAAKHLLELDGIEVADAPEGVTYYHILFDRHELVLSNGAVTESLYTGKEALKGVSTEAREEIFAIFPELRDAEQPPAAARTLVPGRMGRKLAERHHRNGQNLVNP